MRELSCNEVSRVNGGLSSTAKNCVEGGLIGVTEGACLGGLIMLPLFKYLSGANGENLASYFVGAALLVVGAGAFGLLGGAVGTCTGYLASSSQSNQQDP